MAFAFEFAGCVGRDPDGYPAIAEGVDRSLTRIALLGNFPPRLCGIATYTAHLNDALRANWRDIAVDIYAMVDPGNSYPFPHAVKATIDQDRPGSYQAAARAIISSGADLLWVQHEFGIFGGSAGEYLLEILDRLSIPLVVTLHTVLEWPDADQRRVLDRILARASRVIVMAHRARSILRQSYGVPACRISVIEHGVPDCNYVAPSVARRCFGLEDRKTILTFGLLSPGKGIEAMIRAMPAILECCPDAIYRIVGATHPNLIAYEGERHREALKALARSLAVDHALRWEEGFLDEEALLDRIAAADIYVTPYSNPQQITSGTLSYAFGLGKPIVSTPYIHAVELLSHGGGKLVAFDDLKGLSDAVGSLLANDLEREHLAKIAYRRGHEFTWTRMAERALDALTGIVSPRDDRPDNEVALSKRHSPRQAWV
jgi:glycosyltransferase involved in cell wall biosynthesis